MFSAGQKVHASEMGGAKISMLLVSPDEEDLFSLRHILRDENSDFLWCSSCEEAGKRLAKMRPQVVICERDLPDGCWKDLFSHLQDMTEPPPLLVISRDADEHLWAEVLNLGGYDVLLKPFEAAELTRVIPMAAQHRPSPHEVIPALTQCSREQLSAPEFV